MRHEICRGAHVAIHSDVDRLHLWLKHPIEIERDQKSGTMALSVKTRQGQTVYIVTTLQDDDSVMTTLSMARGDVGLVLSQAEARALYKVLKEPFPISSRKVKRWCEK
jgi:hypothetical protein